jgi:hypothetical protein
MFKHASFYFIGISITHIIAFKFIKHFILIAGCAFIIGIRTCSAIWITLNTLVR